MEYAAGGELYDYLSERKVLSEEEARRIFRQIAIACYYCHKHKICHRDLKLENILLDENGNAKVDIIILISFADVFCVCRLLILVYQMFSTVKDFYRRFVDLPYTLLRK